MTMSVLSATLSIAHLGLLHPVVSIGLQCPAPFFRAHGLSAVAASSVLLPHTSMQSAQGPSAFAEPRARPVRMGLISKARGGVNLAVLAFFVALLASRIDPVVLALNLLGKALKLACSSPRQACCSGWASASSWLVDPYVRCKARYSGRWRRFLQPSPPSSRREAAPLAAPRTYSGAWHRAATIAGPPAPEWAGWAEISPISFAVQVQPTPLVVEASRA